MGDEGRVFLRFMERMLGDECGVGFCIVYIEVHALWWSVWEPWAYDP